MDTNIAPDRSFSVVIASTGRELPVPHRGTLFWTFYLMPALIYPHPAKKGSVELAEPGFWRVFLIIATWF